jgi:nitrate reductase alpha subunit
VFDLFVANYGIDRGLGGGNVASSYDDNVPYTPAWAEKITGVPRDQIIVGGARIRQNAEKTKGRSMVILGAGLNHWYHMDMNYRGIINMLVMCGCVGQSGWRLVALCRAGKAAPADRLDAARLRASTGAPAAADELDLVLLCPYRSVALRDAECRRRSCRRPRPQVRGMARLIDYNIRAERMGWLPSAPQLKTNPLAGRQADAAAAGMEPKDYVARNRLKDGELKLACEDPDNPKNWPRNMFVWRSNLLGASGKGHEYFLKHLLGTSTA